MNFRRRVTSQQNRHNNKTGQTIKEGNHKLEIDNTNNTHKTENHKIKPPTDTEFSKKSNITTEQTQQQQWTNNRRRPS